MVSPKIAALLGIFAAVDAWIPTTCGEGSVAANMDFCDRSLSFEQRAALLVAHLNETEKLELWSPPHPTQYIARLNLKGYEPVMILQSTFLVWAPCSAQLWTGFSFPRIALSFHDRCTPASACRGGRPRRPAPSAGAPRAGRGPRRR